jgi:hypothetical protein
MLLLPSVAAAVMFMVVHTEGRFLAGYIAISWLALYVGVLVAMSHIDGRWARAVLTGVSAILVFEVLTTFLYAGKAGPVQESIAHAVAASGVPDGSALAVVWRPDVSKSYGWARLGRHRIVGEAEIGGCQLWSLSPSRQAAVLSGLAASGAQFAVAVDIDGCAVPAPWKAVSDGRFAVLDVHQALPARPNE